MMLGLRCPLAVAAAGVASLVLAAGAYADNGGKVLICKATNQEATEFVLVSVSAGANVGGQGWLNTYVFPFNDYYGSCAEQFADLGNH
jgi:hypothetical protein